MSVDLEALEKRVHILPVEDRRLAGQLIAEVRALRAERDALRARVAELERLGDDLDWQANLHRRHKPESPIGIASAAWRRAVRG